MMLGFLLARAGVDVIVLEKHADFLRDFRGDTIHPSTLELMHELGLLGQFLELPHQQLSQLSMTFGDETLPGPDFSHLPTQCKFIALLPQWDFLNFIAGQGRHYRGFHLYMQTKAVDLLEGGGRITGVRAETPDKTLMITADLVIGADGRDSQLRNSAGLEVRELGVPIDVLWFRLSRNTDHASGSLGHFRRSRLLVTINRRNYWQCGYLINKGEFVNIRERGIENFRKDIIDVVPDLSASVNELQDWEQVRLLTVQINRLDRWYRPGLLCIGDAAHAMSPAGGVGINLAIQDAVATANQLAMSLKRGRDIDDRDLEKIQKRREWPVRLTQAIQVFMHKRLLRPGAAPNRPPWPAKILLGWPVFRRIPAYIIGIGFRPEHNRTDATDSL